MPECLQTKKSNCKNCYKCIRYCPVKSLKFTDGQAHIIRNECVLCGECYVVCPQNAKQIRDDVPEARKLIADGGKVFASIAPSYAARYHGKNIADIRAALKKLGFYDVRETAVGAAIVKKEYERMVREKESDIIISSCCHTVNSLIARHFTNALPYLAKVLSPMQAHAKRIKEENEGAKVVFIGPCISKKQEAEKYPGYADTVLTFEELDKWLAEEGITIESGNEDDFNGRTRIFPTSGGILASMDKQEDVTYLVVDGMENCINALTDIENGEIKNCFIEMSACSGSCISGPVLKRTHQNPLENLLEIKKGAGKTDFGVEAEKDLFKDISFEGISASVMPGEAEIKEILRKMGKTDPEKELNCGSCDCRVQGQSRPHDVPAVPEGQGGKLLGCDYRQYPERHNRS